MTYHGQPLKWAGGKGSLLPILLPIINKCDTIVEPFMGSGVVFNNSQHRKGLLADGNRDLILFHSFLRNHRDSFIKDCAEYFDPKYNTESAFLELRELFNSTLSDWQKAVLFIYLNRHCFNGLCRYNGSGRFNVSFGKYAKPTLPVDAMKRWSDRLQAVELLHADYKVSLGLVPKNAMVYIDPPYTPKTATSSFVGYTEGGFTHEDHVVYKALADALPNPVVISNHDLPVTRELYHDYELKSVKVRRRISCKGDARLAVNELIAIKRTP